MTSEAVSAQERAEFDAVVNPASQPLGGRLTAQPSKNYTTRYLLAMALSEGGTVSNCATSADSAALQRCLKQLGAEFEFVTGVSSGAEPLKCSSADLRVTGFAGKPHLASKDEPINSGNAGAVLRFLLAVAAVLPEVTFVTDYPESLGKRPNGELLAALEQLGCKTESRDGRLPITLRGGELHGGPVTISGANSSQFLSGLLFLSPLLAEPVQISVTNGLVSKAPVRQTIEVLTNAGISVTASDDLLNYTIEPGAYRLGDYRVNGDWPGSAALLAAAAVTGGTVELAGLFDDEQGEKEAGNVLVQMGARFEYLPNGNGVRLSSDGKLRGVEFDGDLATDAVLALMGAACFAQGRTRFYNVSNLRIKECDRITEPLRELRKFGVRCWEGHEIGDPDPDAIIIEGNPEGYEGGVTVDGRDDHRVIMLLSIVALRCRKSVRILRAHQVAKSYPTYFDHFTAMGGDVELVEMQP